MSGTGSDSSSSSGRRSLTPQEVLLNKWNAVSNAINIFKLKLAEVPIHKPQAIAYVDLIEADIGILNGIIG